jgi:hypothetical protein
MLSSIIARSSMALSELPREYEAPFPEGYLANSLSIPSPFRRKLQTVW